MSGLETAGANTVLKPAASLIDALIGPKIDQLKKWSKERDISSQLSNEKTLSLFKSYITRTIHRSSELSTLVFPQTKIPLSEVYEPLQLVAQDPFSIFDEGREINIDLSADGKSYIIIDEAGMGKSTFVKHLSLQAFTYTNKIPILLEFSSYDKSLTLIESIAKKLDDLDKNFDRDLFKKMVVNGYFIIILDGFDELSQELQKNLSLEMLELDLKKEKSSLILTSRPLNNYPDLSYNQLLSIKRLDKNQAKSLVIKYDKFAKLDVGKRLINEFDDVPNVFLETPLLVGLLYKTFGFNNSIAKNISAFYYELFDALYKGHDLTKAGFVRQKM